MVLTFEFEDKILQCDHQMKARKQDLTMVLFVMVYKVVLTFEFVIIIVIIIIHLYSAFSTRFKGAVYKN